MIQMIQKIYFTYKSDGYNAVFAKYTNAMVAWDQYSFIISIAA